MRYLLSMAKVSEDEITYFRNSVPKLSVDETKKSEEESLKRQANIKV